MVVILIALMLCLNMLGKVLLLFTYSHIMLLVGNYFCNMTLLNQEAFETFSHFILRKRVAVENTRFPT